MSKPIIVISPGGFTNPSSYDAAAEEIRKLGYTVIVPTLTVNGDLAGKGPDSIEWKTMADSGVLDDVEVLHSHLLPAFDDGREVILVVHSYGALPGSLSVQGQTVPERKAKGLKGGVKAYVGLASPSYPVRGKSIMGTDEDMPPMPYHSLEVRHNHVLPREGAMD